MNNWDRIKNFTLEEFADYIYSVYLAGKLSRKDYNCDTDIYYANYKDYLCEEDTEE